MQPAKPIKYLLYAEQNYAYAMLRPLQDAIYARGGEVRWYLAGTQIEASYLKDNETQVSDVASVEKWQPDVVISPSNTVPDFFPGLKVDVFHGFNVRSEDHTSELHHVRISYAV